MRQPHERSGRRDAGQYHQRECAETRGRRELAKRGAARLGVKVQFEHGQRHQVRRKAEETQERASERRPGAGGADSEVDMSVDAEDRKPLIIGSDQGRGYDMGRMRAVFYADGAETGGRYSISEWWLEPYTGGPGSHAHADEHIFRVLTGTLCLFIDDVRTDLGMGGYALIPGGVAHHFENRGAEACGFISINVPGGFEQKMPGIVQWFDENPPEILAQESASPGMA
jgi:mannose-6-phosphate isomerase-like protein (cupin superfamily)